MAQNSPIDVISFPKSELGWLDEPEAVADIQNTQCRHAHNALRWIRQKHWNDIATHRLVRPEMKEQAVEVANGLQLAIDDLESDFLAAIHKSGSVVLPGTMPPLPRLFLPGGTYTGNLRWRGLVRIEGESSQGTILTLAPGALSTDDGTSVIELVAAPPELDGLFDPELLRLTLLGNAGQGLPQATTLLRSGLTRSRLTLRDVRLAYCTNDAVLLRGLGRFRGRQVRAIGIGRHLLRVHGADSQPAADAAPPVATLDRVVWTATDAAEGSATTRDPRRGAGLVRMSGGASGFLRLQHIWFDSSKRLLKSYNGLIAIEDPAPAGCVVSLRNVRGNVHPDDYVRTVRAPAALCALRAFGVSIRGTAMLFQDSSFTPGDAGMHYVASSRFDIPGDDFGLVLGGGLLPNRLGIDGRTLGFEDLSKKTTGERFRPGDVRFARNVDGTGSPLGRLYRDPTDFQWKFSDKEKGQVRRNGYHRSGVPAVKLDGVPSVLWSSSLLLPATAKDKDAGGRRAIVLAEDQGQLHVGDIVVATAGTVGEFFRVVSRAGSQVQLLTMRLASDLPTSSWPADTTPWLVTPWAPTASNIKG